MSGYANTRCSCPVFCRRPCPRLPLSFWMPCNRSPSTSAAGRMSGARCRSRRFVAERVGWNLNRTGEPPFPVCSRLNLPGVVCRLAFHTPVRQDCLVRIVAAIRPTRFATRIPEPILEEWGDYLAAGTLARVLSQSGPQVGWSNPDGSTLHFSLYEEGVAKARIRAVRGLDSFITYPSIRVREAI